LGGLLGLAAALAGWRSALPAAGQGVGTVYAQATIERGRQLAAAGNCAGCHTAPGGLPNAGGLAMQTPFGRVFTTNLTPDAQTGLGLWSYAAFERAMREGISRDGRHLYPAFPFTSFAKTSDQDLTAIYAYLMAQPAVSAPTPPAEMAFPFSVRPLMAAWNGLFHDAKTFVPEPGQSAEWNRGAYLVNGLGHCSACHTPRNALGAELGGKAFLAGAMVNGWEAPALTSLSRAPVPWTETELYRYFRQGHTEAHGIAAGPMGDVVKELRHLPDADVQAMARYLASFNVPLTDADSAAQARQVVLAAQQTEPGLRNQGQRLFNGACASCHHDGDGPRLLGVNTPLALNSNLHSARPDNLIRNILDGIRTPATQDIGFMPAFRHSLSDEQVASLAGYMRSRYAPGQPAWPDLPQTVSRLRALPGSH
jgi:nicotinate dehydrogenase subunit B